MSENLHLVFSNPPAWLDDDDYNRWYDAHLAEILVVPGFTAARRYRLGSAVGSRPPGHYRFLSAYEIEGDPADVMRQLAFEEGSGRMQLPEWFPEIHFASFNCHTHGNETLPTLTDHLYLVFSAPPPDVSEDDYVAWYREHAAENTLVPGFRRAWRFRLEPIVVDSDSPSEASHLAAYEVDADLAELRAALADARRVNEEHFPSWFGQIPFVSLDAVAIGARQSELD